MNSTRGSRENDGETFNTSPFHLPAGGEHVPKFFSSTLPTQFGQFPQSTLVLQQQDGGSLDYQRSLMIQQYQALQYQQLMQYQHMVQYQQMMQFQNMGPVNTMPGSAYDAYPQQVMTVEMMYAHTIEELKKYVSMVNAEDVRRVIEQSKIVPREMAYTSLIQMAGKMRQVEKAVAIFEAMKNSKHAVRPNMYSYTALISALARVGDWQSAEKYFSEMTALSKTDPTVAPNRVTFSSMISVYEKAKKFDSAIEMYERQLEANIQPDLITYLSVLGACQASREETALNRAADIIENMHASNLTGTPMMYLNLLAACENHAQIGVRVLDGMRKRGTEITPSMYNTVMQSLFSAGRKDQAVELAKHADRESVRLNHAFFDSVLKLCAEAGDYPSSDAIHSMMIKSNIHTSPQCAGLILCAHMQGNDSVEAIERLNEQFKREGIIPVLPVRKEVVECVHEVLGNTADAQPVEMKTLGSTKTNEHSDVSAQSEVDTAIM